MVDTLKACGHQVTLVLKVGPHHYQNGCGKEDKEGAEENGHEREEEENIDGEREEEEGLVDRVEQEEEEKECDGQNEDNIVSHVSSHDSSCDSQPQQYEYSDHSPPNDELEIDSKSPQTPESFEGDTDFSGMLSLDLKQTASVPLTETEKASALEASTESMADSLNAGSSCDELDGSPVPKRGEPSFEERLESRTSGDGRLRQSVAVSLHQPDAAVVANSYCVHAFLCLYISAGSGPQQTATVSLIPLPDLGI